MKILIVAMSNSIHTAKWIEKIVDKGWDIHLLPSIDIGKLHPLIKGIVVHHSIYSRDNNLNEDVQLKGLSVWNKSFATFLRILINKFFPRYQVHRLKRLIDKIKPDIIHSMETQHAGYLVYETRKLISGDFPKWLLTIWGSDLFLFGKLNEHKDKVKKVVLEADYFSCECQRDVRIVKEYGYTGRIFPPFPITAGFDFQHLAKLRQNGSASNRRVIMLKGYQGWAGRAFVGLRALERCADLLGEYELVIYSADKDVSIAAELLTEKKGLSVSILESEQTSHDEILSYHGKARISIGLSISDGISTSLLEALAMGSFPIQSWTSCAEEWIVDGKTGILVHPEDPDEVEKALRLVLLDDNLVDNAATVNQKLAQDQLGYEKIEQMIVEQYKSINNPENGDSSSSKR